MAEFDYDKNRKKEIDPFDEEYEENMPPRAMKSAPMDAPIKKRELSPEDIKNEVGFPPAYEKNLPLEPQQGEYSPLQEAPPEPTGEVPPGYESYGGNKNSPYGDKYDDREYVEEYPGEGRYPDEPIGPQEDPFLAPPAEAFPPGEPPEMPPEESISVRSPQFEKLMERIEQISEDISEIKEKQNELEEKIEKSSTGEMEEIKASAEKIDSLLSTGFPALIKVVQDIRKKKTKQ